MRVKANLVCSLWNSDGPAVDLSDMRAELDPGTFIIVLRVKSHYRSLRPPWHEVYGIVPDHGTCGWVELTNVEEVK